MFSSAAFDLLSASLMLSRAVPADAEALRRSLIIA